MAVYKVSSYAYQRVVFVMLLVSMSYRSSFFRCVVGAGLFFGFAGFFFSIFALFVLNFLSADFFCVYAFEGLRLPEEGGLRKNSFIADQRRLV